MSRNGTLHAVQQRSRTEHVEQNNLVMGVEQADPRAELGNPTRSTAQPLANNDSNNPKDQPNRTETGSTGTPLEPAARANVQALNEPRTGTESRPRSTSIETRTRGPGRDPKKLRKTTKPSEQAEKDPPAHRRHDTSESRRKRRTRQPTPARRRRAPRPQPSTRYRSHHNKP